MNETIKNWIKNQRLHGKSWDWLLTVGKTSDEDLREFLKDRVEYDFWDDLSPEEWKSIVCEEKRLSEIDEKIYDESGATVLGANNEDNFIVIPSEENSAWQCYKNKLLNDGFGIQTVSSIEKSAVKTLKHLSRDTMQTGPIKGLVVGNVQSGKTANMAALMAMAADNGWNMFIILSGIIESLRVQTQKRLNNDLNNWEARFNSRFNWQTIDNPIAAEQYGRRVQDYDFDLKSNQRYFAVCLKNSTRLRNLIEWLARGGEKRKDIRLLIIDDEADQASINVSPTERSKINTLILNLINGRNSKGTELSDKFRAVNYIGYTATPFANVLNEAPGKESLYPSHFIATLAVSDEYFGPQQIFGCKDTVYDGLNVIRNVSDGDIDGISNIHQRESVQHIPQSLEDAICWFLCGVSCMRVWKYKKPISMLIHTSRLKKHHGLVASAIEQWITATPQEIIEKCKSVWEREKGLFDVEHFLEQYPNYNNANGGANIRRLPSFNEIKTELTELLDKGLTDIIINGDNEPVYSEGIHLCIDNSETNKASDTMKRLLYPDANNMPDKAPAFIVIGGQTLSRGLTIEGLISTFFLRSSLAADTLMQMGRWFGYRRGYELLPRLWMSENAREQFEFMSEMDYALRQEIKEMHDTGVDFSEVGPRIKTSPTNVIRIVAHNRMNDAIDVEFDFTGHTMETGVFKNDEEVLSKNLETAEKFISSLGDPIARPHINAHNYMWEGVELEKIIEFLRSYKYSERAKGFNDIEPLIGWLEKFTSEDLIGRWNVILAGNKTGDNRWEPVSGISISKVNHTQRGLRRDNTINIGVLRSPEDFLTDIPIESAEEEKGIKESLNGSHKTSEINNLRGRYGLNQTPQLVLYVINKDSVPREGTKNRYALNAVEDIVGFSINLTGERNGNSAVRAVTIHIPNNGNLDITD